MPAPAGRRKGTASAASGVSRSGGWVNWTLRKGASYNEEVSEHRRILGLDLGSKRIGLAVSDPLGVTAQGLPTLKRTNRRADLERLRELVDAYQVERIVLGHPLHLKGYASARAEEAERFAEWLRRDLKLPVELFDERLTSAEAERLMREAGASRRARREAADQIAAQLILQTYLDRARSLAPVPKLRDSGPSGTEA
jgi:putative Holliday junction resolvase